MKSIEIDEVEIPKSLKKGNRFELDGKKGIISEVLRNKNVITIKFENDKFIYKIVYNFIIESGYMELIPKSLTRNFSINSGPSSKDFKQQKTVSFETEKGQIRGMLIQVSGKSFELKAGSEIYSGNYNFDRRNGNMRLKT